MRELHPRLKQWHHMIKFSRLHNLGASTCDAFKCLFNGLNHNHILSFHFFKLKTDSALQINVSLTIQKNIYLKVFIFAVQNVKLTDFDLYNK